MNHAGYEYEVKPVLELTRDEVWALNAMANGHYDGHCYSFSRPGGLIRKFQNLFENKFDDDTGVIKVTITYRELDTLCKIVEQDTFDPSRWNSLRDTLDQTRREQKRMTDRGKETKPDV